MDLIKTQFSQLAHVLLTNLFSNSVSGKILIEIPLKTSNRSKSASLNCFIYQEGFTLFYGNRVKLRKSSNSKLVY